MSSTSVRNELVASLREMLRAHGRPLLQHEASTKLMLSRAVTKKKRQEMLALFFRSVFAEVRLRFILLVIENRFNFRSLIVHTHYVLSCIHSLQLCPSFSCFVFPFPAQDISTLASLTTVSLLISHSNSSLIKRLFS